MNYLKRWICEKPRHGYSVFFWNMLSGGVYAIQPALLLIFVSRFFDIMTAGTVSIAYALANLFMMVGRYGVRTYQSTDVAYEYNFTDYLKSRYLTLVGALLVGFSYLFLRWESGDYSDKKCFLIGFIIILKAIDAFQDVFLGEYQRCGKFIIGAKIAAITQCIDTILISIGLIITKGALLSFAIGVIAAALCSLVLLGLTRFEITNNEGKKKSKEGWLGVIKKCFPLCVAMVLSIYVGNLPKYAVDFYLSDDIQAVLGYLMLPAFVITLLSQFLYNPYMKQLADLWVSKKYNNFRMKVLEQISCIGVIVVAVLLVGRFIGIPVVSLIYHIDLSSYLVEFMLLLTGGGIYAIVYYLSVPLTTMRMQNYVAIGFGITTIVMLILQKHFTVEYKMIGAIGLYCVANLLLLVFLMLIVLIRIKIEKQKCV